MILRGLKSTFRAAGAKTPKGLSQSLSAISKEPELATLLKKWNSQFKGKEEKLASAFTQGLMASISGRPYLISSEQMRVNSTIAANQYVGTGIVLRMDKKYGPTMPKVFFNGPAWKAGAKDGDVIVNIDDDDARKMPLQTVLRRLRGAKGSLVTVVVRQPNSDKTRTLKITRNVAFIPTVEGFKQLSAGKWQFTTDGKQVPFAFELKYDASQIKANHRYNVRASIHVDSKLRFATDTIAPVITDAENTESLNLRLVGVR